VYNLRAGRHEGPSGGRGKIPARGAPGEKKYDPRKRVRPIEQEISTYNTPSTPLFPSR